MMHSRCTTMLLCFYSVLFCVLCGTNSLHAQEDEQTESELPVADTEINPSEKGLKSEPEQEQKEDVEKITVTGSHIKGVDVEGHAPIITIDEEYIESSTAENISELLKEFGVTRGGGGSFSTATSGALQGDSPVGQAAISLRGLGTSSTLVLINGRRVSASSFAFQSQNFVDVNSIPTAALERVEILATGASAIYGADAIAGVVNFIMKSDYEGAEVQVTYSNTEAASDNSIQNVNAAWGGRLGDTQVTIFADYFKREPLFDRDREITARSLTPSRQGIFPSLNSEDFYEDDLVDPSCPDEQRFDGRSDRFPSASFGAYCEYNQNEVFQTYPERQSYSLFAFTATDLSNSLRWSNELSLSNNRSNASSAGAPFTEVPIAYDHPNIPESMREAFADQWEREDVSPRDELLIWGRFVRPRTIANETNSLRFVSELAGDIGMNWQWQSALQYSFSRSEQRAKEGIINVEKFDAALLGNLCADGTTECSPDESGLFFNPFGGQTSNSSQIWDLLEEDVVREGDSVAYGVDFNHFQ